MAILKKLLLFLFPVLVLAQPDTTSIQIKMDVLNAEDIDQTTIVGNKTFTAASRLPTDLEDIPFTAYIISEEQIKQRGYLSLVDVLKDLPGIKVSQPGSALHGETFLMRGMFGNYYVKILVDDLPIQPSASSGMPIFAQLPISQAERIEVLYGPAAAVYGADAMAGVINIKTKRADKLVFMDADGSIGFPGNYHFDATVGGQYGKNNRVWNYMFYGGINHYNNLPITGDQYADEYDPSNYVLPGEENIYLNSDYYKGTKTRPTFSQLPNRSEKFGFRFGHKKLVVGLDFGRRESHSAIGNNPIYSAYHDPNTRFGEQIIRLFGSYKTDIGNWSSQTNLQLLSYQINPASSYITIDNPTNKAGLFYTYGASTDLYFEELFSRELGRYWTVLAGFNTQFSGNLPQYDYYTDPFNPWDYKAFSTSAPANHTDLDSFGVGPYNFLNIGGLVDVSYRKEHWSVVLGVRADYREFFGFALSPRAGVVYKVNREHALRFSASTAYRPPSSYLVKNGVLYQNVGGVSRGIPYANNSLSAERLYNVGAGWSFTVSTNHTIDVSAFYHVNQNLITKTSYSSINNGQLTDYYGFVNDQNSSAQLFGIQLVHRIKHDFGNTSLNSEASVNYSKGNEELPFNRGSLSNYRGQPELMAKLLLELNFLRSFRASLRTHYFSQWTTRSVVISALESNLTAPSGFFMDFQLSYAIHKDKEVYIRIDNLTNNDYYGIGASGGAGVLGGSSVVFQDLIFNPQMLRVIKIGVRISI